MKHSDDRTRMITRICGTFFSSLIITKPVDKGSDHNPPVETLRKLKAMDFPSFIGFSELDILCKQIEDEECDITFLQSLITTVFGSPSCLNQSFMSNVNCYRQQRGTGIDFKAMHRVYQRVLNIDPDLTNKIVKVCTLHILSFKCSVIHFNLFLYWKSTCTVIGDSGSTESKVRGGQSGSDQFTILLFDPLLSGHCESRVQPRSAQATQ